MNEQIKQLWDKVDLQEEGNPPSVVITSESELQKFAEMIVEECEAKHFSEGYLCGKKDGRFLAIHECSEYLRERGDISRAIDLREHFGVK